MSIDYDIQFPSHTDVRGWIEASQKGWFPGTIIRTGDAEYECCFYDPVRLAQDCPAELEANGYFYEPNLIFLPEITQEHIKTAIDDLAKLGFYGLAPRVKAPDDLGAN